MRTLPCRIAAACLVFMTAGASAAAAYKCVLNGTVSYQQAPCPSDKGLRKEPSLEELNAAEKRKRRQAAAATPAAPAVPTKKPVEPAAPAAAPEAPRPAASFRCDGRQHCSQMKSCAEAKFFLANCPDTQMDGDHDGIPCEQQWCVGPFAK